MPQPIASAPRDGTVILTDVGFVLYIDESKWGSPVKSGWANCSPQGSIYECADDGIYYDSPTIWEPVPDWIPG
jgi:hypothetical protein